MNSNWYDNELTRPDYDYEEPLVRWQGELYGIGELDDLLLAEAEQVEAA